MSTFEHLITRTERSQFCEKDDRTILELKQRRAMRAINLRAGEHGLPANEAYLLAHRTSLKSLGLTPDKVAHIEGLTPQNSGRSAEEIAKIQGRLGLYGEEIHLPIAS